MFEQTAKLQGNLPDRQSVRRLGWMQRLRDSKRAPSGMLQRVEYNSVDENKSSSKSTSPKTRSFPQNKNEISGEKKGNAGNVGEKEV